MQTATTKLMGTNVKQWKTDDGELLCRLWNSNVIQIADRFRSRCSALHYVASSRKSALATGERIAALLEQ